MSNTEELLDKVLGKMEECIEAERHVNEALTKGQGGKAALDHYDEKNAEFNHLLRLATDSLAASEAKLRDWQ